MPRKNANDPLTPEEEAAVEAQGRVLAREERELGDTGANPFEDTATGD